MALKDGSKLTLNITTYANTEKKDAKVEAFNQEVMAGKVKPTSNYDMAFTIKKKALINADEYAIGYNVGGVDYFSYVVCKNDTIYSCRNRGIVTAGTADNPIGYGVQGIQTLPMRAKINDTLPSFEDFSFLFPSTTDVTLKKAVFLGYEKQSSTSEFGYFVDTQTGQSGFGAYSKTPAAKKVYKMIDVKAKQTVQVSSHSIQGVNCIVTGEEELTISGVKYRAYIIESESWTKSNINISYESADEDLNKAEEEAHKKIGKQIEKFNVRRKFTNKLGYVVMYSKQWVVPQLGGGVKTISYDVNGGISTIMTVTKLE